MKTKTILTGITISIALFIGSCENKDNSQHITANRKAYAMWWILARIAGWNGE